MTESDARQRIADAAVAFWQRCAPSYTYHQRRPYPASLYDAAARDGLDCSSTAILVYKEAGQPDPNGTNYDGTGWTGSLIQRGEPVDSSAFVQPGDLIFYGNPVGPTGHVTVAIGGGECISFGSTPISRHPIGYRPIVAIRRYPVTVPEPPALPHDRTLRLYLTPAGHKRRVFAGWDACKGPMRWIAKSGLEPDTAAAIAWRGHTWRGPKTVSNVVKHLVNEHLNTTSGRAA